MITWLGITRFFSNNRPDIDPHAPGCPSYPSKIPVTAASLPFPPTISLRCIFAPRNTKQRGGSLTRFLSPEQQAGPSREPQKRLEPGVFFSRPFVFPLVFTEYPPALTHTARNQIRRSHWTKLTMASGAEAPNSHRTPAETDQLRQTKRNRT